LSRRASPTPEAKSSKEQPVANLPVPSEEFLKDVQNPRRQLARFYARLVIILALLTAVLAVLAGYFGDTALLVVVLVVGSGLVFAYTCGALMARSAAGGVDRQLEDFRHDKHLAVWHCSADEWRQFAEVQRRLLQEEGKLQLIVVGTWAGIFGLFGTIAGFAWNAEHGGVVGVIGIVVSATGGILAGAIFGLACDWFFGMGPSAARRRYRRALSGGGPTCIGPKGAYTNGEFHGWGDRWCRLRAASFVEDHPPHLHLVLARPQADPSVPGTSTDALEDLCIPVPAGHEDEARQVVQLLGGPGGGRPERQTARPLTADQILSAYPRCRKWVKGWVQGAQVDLLRQSLLAVMKFLEGSRELKAAQRSKKKWKNLATFLADLPEDVSRDAEGFFHGQGLNWKKGTP
jgi:hypothetical protein